MAAIAGGFTAPLAARTEKRVDGLALGRTGRCRGEVEIQAAILDAVDADGGGFELGGSGDRVGGVDGEQVRGDLVVEVRRHKD